MSAAVNFDLSSGYTKLIGLGDNDIQAAFYPDGSIGIRHICDRSIRPRDGRVGIIAPRLDPLGHVVISEQPLTITPSVGCSDCGLHGFITNGEWMSC